jgi:hypothetical protein
MTMFIRKYTMPFFALALSGCLNSASVAESPNARPGKNLIPPDFAGNFFTEVCLVTAPSFEGVAGAIAGEPFVRHKQTGTYFHKFADLSIKVSDYGCSLVFKSELSKDETLAGLAAGVTKNAKNWNVTVPRNLDITSNPSPDGKGRYFRIGLPR